MSELAGLPAAEVRVGIDIVDIGRFRETIERRPGIVERIFTETERKRCDAAADPAVRYAARFAVKEATRKALGRSLDWRACETRNDADGAPSLALPEGTITGDGLRIAGASVSISHDGPVATAIVMITTEASER